MRRLLITAIAIAVAASAPVASAQTAGQVTFTLLPNPPFPAGTLAEQLACPQAHLRAARLHAEPDRAGDDASAHARGRRLAEARVPIPTAQVTFADFACPAVDACEALINGTPYQWDMHHTWTPQTLAPTGLPNAGVGTVACADASDCVAEGGGTIGSKDVPFVERWDGTAWSFVALTRPPHGGDLFDIACATKTMCMTVGNEAHPNAQNVGFSSSIAYRHSGSTWNLSHAPDTKNAIFGQLTGVACPSVHTCLATSTFTNDGDAGQAQADGWHDGHWRLTPLPGIPAAAIKQGTSGIGAPACMTASACIAVGSWDYFTTADHTGPLVEVWNGQTWRYRRGPLPVPTDGGAGSGTFGSVACGSPTTCILAGDYTTTTGTVNLYVAERDQPASGG